ncbi:MAG: D-glycerate dehydrogenase [Firmicutes bacterium]|nr:D-glycerate dehydrogenase [Bacillota bacterium]
MARPKVYVTRRIPAAAMGLLQERCDVRLWDEEDVPVPRAILLDELAGADGAFVLLTERIDEEALAGAPRLKMVANMAVGYDNIDVDACTRAGVMVANTPGVLTETTADLTWALLLAAARRLVEAQKVIEQGRWRAWSPMFLAGQDVYGRTLGIIGAGRIGAAVARRARGFDMTVLYHNRRRRPELEAETGARYVSLDELLASSDFVVILVPLTPETRHLIDEDALRKMKPTAVLVNTARGPVVDEAALVRALKEGWIWGAGLDVWEKEPIGPDHPLLGLPNVVALPHIGSASIATRTRMAVVAAENLLAGVTGRRPPNLVNPEVWERLREGGGPRG